MRSPRWQGSAPLLFLAALLPLTAPAELLPELGVSLRHVWDRNSVNLLELELDPVLEWRRDANRVRLAARLRAQSSELLDRRRPENGGYSSASRPRNVGDRVTAELREAYWDGNAGPWRFAAGKQLLNWGTLDGYKILDALNPQDFREFILDDFNDSRIGTWSAHLERGGPRWRWELFWSPDRTVHDLPDPGTAFAFYAPRLRFGGIPANGPLTAGIQEPDTDTVAVRLTHQSENGDWSLMVLDGFDYEPVAGGPTAADGIRYPERRMFGASFQRSYGRLVVRGEAAWRNGRELNTLADGVPGVAPVDQLSAGIGIDYAAPWDLFVSLQLIREQLLQAPATLVRPARDTLSTLYLRRMFRNDTVKIDLRWYNTFEDRDGLVRFGVSYDNGRYVNVSLGADYFYGTRAGLFGQYTDSERVYIMWKKTF